MLNADRGEFLLFLRMGGLHVTVPSLNIVSFASQKTSFGAAVFLMWKHQRLLCVQLWMSTMSGTQQSKLSVKKKLLHVTNIYLKLIFKARDRLKFLLSSKFLALQFKRAPIPPCANKAQSLSRFYS